MKILSFIFIIFFISLTLFSQSTTKVELRNVDECEETGGNTDGGGGCQWGDLRPKAAWFTRIKSENRDRKISYCFYKSKEGFKIEQKFLRNSRTPIIFFNKEGATFTTPGKSNVIQEEIFVTEEDFEQSLINSFKKYDLYLKERVPGSSAEKYIARSLGNKEECSDKTDLTIYWGDNIPEQLREAVKEKSTSREMPMAYAGRTRFPGEKGWGKGFIWLNKGENSIRWDDEIVRNSILMREVGRVLGVVDIIDNTVFRSDLNKIFTLSAFDVRDDSDKSVEKQMLRLLSAGVFDYSKIDHEMALLFPTKIKKNYAGTFDRKESSYNFFKKERLQSSERLEPAEKYSPLYEMMTGKKVEVGKINSNLSLIDLENKRIQLKLKIYETEDFKREKLSDEIILRYILLSYDSYQASLEASEESDFYYVNSTRTLALRKAEGSGQYEVFCLKDKNCPDDIKLIIGFDSEVLSAVIKTQESTVDIAIATCDDLSNPGSTPLFVTYLGDNRYESLTQNSYRCKGNASIRRKSFPVDINLNQLIETSFGISIPASITYYDSEKKIQRPLFWPKFTGNYSLNWNDEKDEELDIWQRGLVYKEIDLKVAKRMTKKEFRYLKSRNRKWIKGK